MSRTKQGDPVAVRGKTRWLFADQLGPHFLDDRRQPVLLIESKGVFRRRTYHRQKAHLVLSALRHRAAELGDQATYLRTETYRDGLRRTKEPVEVCHPTSRRARTFVYGLDQVTVLPARGFITSMEDFAGWADLRRGALRMDDFYRFARHHHQILVTVDKPEGGRWSFDEENREPPPKKTDRLEVPPPPAIEEDDIDAEVRRDLDRWAAEGIRFVGRDGPRLFPASRAEAQVRLTHFIRYRLPDFGPYEDAMLARDPFMAHSMLSSSFNLGLLDPMEAIRAAERAYRTTSAPLASAEGFIRQLLGWRDFIWHLYWYFDAGYRSGNRLIARRSVPRWWEELDADAVQARCLSDVLAGVRDRGWVHHVPRLMVLGNYALQRGWRPGELVDWFHRCFVDGYEWVMPVNVVGMSQYAGLGAMSTKPYASGGAYINRMSDYCGGCRYDPRRRVGDKACPYTAGYWYFLDRVRGLLPINARMARSLTQLDRLRDLAEVRAQEKKRADRAP